MSRYFKQPTNRLASIAGCIFVVAATLLSGPFASAEVSVSEEVLTRGRAVTATVVDESGAPVVDGVVRALYFPNSKVEREVEVGTTDAAGQVEWTPSHPGIAVLSASSDDTSHGSSSYSVRFDGVPASGLAVFVVAATILLGGLVFGIRRLQSEQR